MLVLFSLQSSLQSSVHPEYSLIYISLRPMYSVQSSTHLEHIWNTAGHIWCIVLMHSWSQLELIWKHVGHSWTRLDISSVQSNAHLVYSPRVHPSIQCRLPSSAHPVCHPSLVQLRVLSAVRPCTIPCTVQCTLCCVQSRFLCMVQYTCVHPVYS